MTYAIISPYDGMVYLFTTRENAIKACKELGISTDYVQEGR